MTAPTLLLIDDDTQLAGLLRDYLARFNYRLLTAGDGEEGLKVLLRERPNLVILDVMLPGKDGFETCREIRRVSDVPVIMLTARGEVADRVVGLELGADDYLAKPFEPRELVARIQTVLRRGRPASAVLKFGKLEIDTTRQRVTLAGKPVDLTTTEYEALALFARNPGKVFSRDDIMDALRGQSWEAFNRSVDVLMSRLRSKLGDDPKRPTYFKTVWGTGYTFLGSHDVAE